MVGLMAWNLFVVHFRVANSLSLLLQTRTGVRYAGLWQTPIANHSNICETDAWWWVRLRTQGVLPFVFRRRSEPEFSLWEETQLVYYLIRYIEKIIAFKSNLLIMLVLLIKL